MIIFTVNGKERQLEKSDSLSHYLESLGINVDHVAVAYNGTVLSKYELSKMRLSEGDQVEVVQAVGGG